MSLVRRIVQLDETDSTNDDARRHARDGEPEGLVVIARSQRAGRGRLGRAWHSPPGAGLYLSILLRPGEPPDRLGRYAIVAALAAVEACRAAGARASRIKWPNDVVIAGRKVAGILAELRTLPSGAELVVGFGINVRSGEDDLPPELRESATSLSVASGRDVEVGTVASSLLAALDAWVVRLRRGAWDEARTAFLRYAPEVDGAIVKLQGGSSGVTRGLDPSGALRVETSGGVRLLHAGESVVSWGS